MIWLASYGGASPIGNQIATVNIGGVNWALYNGQNSYWTVYSFVAPSPINQFSADIKQFFQYLTNTYPAIVPGSYYLQTIGAGTEPFIGSDAWFTVSSYSISA